MGLWTRSEPQQCPHLDSVLIRTMFFSLNPRRPGDLKEAFNMSTLTLDSVPPECLRVCVSVCEKEREEQILIHKDHV